MMSKYNISTLKTYLTQLAWLVVAPCWWKCAESAMVMLNGVVFAKECSRGWTFPTIIFMGDISKSK